MLLVDSSVWIDTVRMVANESTRLLASRDHDEELATTGIIIQEVLQGFRSDAVFEAWQQRFRGMLNLRPDGFRTYELAAGLYRRARAKGLTVRNPNDCFIAAAALEHGALLVHNDREFLALAQVEPELLIFPGRPH